MIHIVLDQSFTSKLYSSFALKQKWELLAVFEADPDIGQAAQVVCLDHATNTRCYYVEDYLIDLRYLIVEGKKEKELAETIYSAKHIKLIAPEKIFAMVKKSKSRKELVLGLRMLAVISPERFDDRFFDLFSIGLEHKEPAIRHASLKIVTYPGWKQFNAVAREMSKNDPDPVVKESAKGFLKAYAAIHAKKKKKALKKKK